MSGTTYTVSDEAALNAAIIAIDAASQTASGAAYTIDISAGFTMTADLAAISLANSDSLQIIGPASLHNAKLVGAGHRGFTVLSGNVILSALDLNGFKAKGGNGGSGKAAGGGGAGLGGALFVGAGAAVTLANIGFSFNVAAGGHGGAKTGTGTGAGGTGTPGGFGWGGAGGVTPGFGGGGGSGAPGGFGGGANAGGGLAAGANIFVQAGGQLNFAAGTTAAGTLFSGGGNAQTYGNNIFVQGNSTITLGDVTVAGVITDQSASGGVGPNAGAGTLAVDGATDLTSANAYTGGTFIEAGGALTLSKTGAAGSGEIAFAAGANGALVISSKAMLGNVVGDFVTGDTIDIQGMGTATSTSLSTTNTLALTGGTTAVRLKLDPTQSYANYAFVVMPDGIGGGTIVSVITRHFDVATEAGFNAAISLIDKTGADSQPNVQYAITLTAGFTLTTDLDAVNLAAGSSLTINGNGQTIDGGGKYRGLFVYGGTVAVNALTIADAVAAGGAGGSGAAPGGGGAGLGGGLFVAAGTAVTLNDVSFLNDSANGGAGGAIIAGTAAGGGGGLGGAGGAGTSHAGGGGGVGTGAVGGSYGGAGAGQGILLGAGPGMVGQGTNGGGAGGADGGGGGWAGIFSGSGRDPRSTPGPSGAGGDTGNGAFGGGGGNAGGSSAYPGYAAGFGGGAAGAGSAAGYGGGNAGGGGTGAGGDVFVQAGGALTIAGGGSASGGAVAGGVSTIGPNGAAYGSGIYVQGANTLAFAPAAGQTLTESDVIADEAGTTGSGGVTALLMSGAGILALNAANHFSGGLTIDSGTVALNAAGAAGSGTITFGYGANATLIIAVGDVPANTIAFFIPNDVIDLAGIGTATSAVLGANDVLAITGGTTPVSLTFSAAQNFINESFAVATDGHGGTLLTAVDKNGDLPAGIAGAAIAGNDHAAFDPFQNVTIATLIAGQIETATLTLGTTADGALGNPGTGSYNASTGVYTATGTAAQLTADIANLVFSPTSYQANPGTVVNTAAALSVTDGTMTAAAPFNIAVTALNDAPVITGGAGSQDGYWNTPIAPFTGIAITDPDHAAFETVTLSIGNAYGNAVPTGSFALAAPVDGVSLTEVNGNTYTLAGAPSAVTAALQATTFTPAVTAPQLGFTIDSIGIAVSDGIAAPVITSDTVYAGLPIITGLEPTLSVQATATIAPFSKAVITDSAYFTTGSVTITLEPNGGSAGPGTDANGTLTGTGLTKAGVGTYTIATASFATLTTALDSVVFHPTAVAAGQTVTTGFVIDVFDGATTSGWLNNVVTLGKGAIAPAAKMGFLGTSASITAAAPMTLTHGVSTPAPIIRSLWMGGALVSQAGPTLALGALPEAARQLPVIALSHHWA